MPFDFLVETEHATFWWKYFLKKLCQKLFLSKDHVVSCSYRKPNELDLIVYVIDPQFWKCNNILPFELGKEGRLRLNFSASNHAAAEPQYMYYSSNLLASLLYWYICFLPGWCGAEIKYTVHVVLPKWPTN